MLTRLLHRVRATHSPKSVISAGVRSPAPSGQGMDGDAGVLSRVELQRLSDLFWDATLGSILNWSFFGLFFVLCLLSLLLYLLLPFPTVTHCRALLGGSTGLWHCCPPGPCRAACISAGQWRHLLGFSRSGRDEQGRFLLDEDFRTCSITSSPSFSSLCSWHRGRMVMLAGGQRGQQPCCDLVLQVQFSYSVAASPCAPGIARSLRAAVGCNRAPGAQGCLGRAQVRAGPQPPGCLSSGLSCFLASCRVKLACQAHPVRSLPSQPVSCSSLSQTC